MFGEYECYLWLLKTNAHVPMLQSDKKDKNSQSWKLLDIFVDLENTGDQMNDIVNI